jgi:hypothetical protein
VLPSSFQPIDPHEGIIHSLLPLRTAPDLTYLEEKEPAVEAVLHWLRNAETSHLTSGRDKRPEVQVQGEVSLRMSTALLL